MAERGLVASDDINHLGPVAHENISARHLVEAVDRAQQRRFPRARKPHEHADFAFFHHQAGARRTQHGAPIRVANTTMESDSMMHCVRPAMIDGSAAGSSTFHSNCRLVAPKLSPASSMGLGIEVSPRYVMRTGAGMAKMTVTMRAGAAPKPNRMRIGMR